MKKINKRRTIIAILIIILLITLFGKIVYTMIDENESSSDVSLAIYNNIFTKESQGNLQILATVTSNRMQPESTYLYDKKFNLFIFRLVLSKNFILSKDLNTLNGSSNLNNNEIYSGLPAFNFEMYKRSGKTDLVSSIHFKTNDNYIQTIIENDSLACYYCKFKSFSLSYNDAPYDVAGLANKPNIPLGLALVRKNRFLYIVLISASTGELELDPNLLYRIINK